MKNKQKTPLSMLLLFGLSLVAIGLHAQGVLISAPPQDGKGKQVVSIHSNGGQTKMEEGAYNLLYNSADGSKSTKKWCNTSKLYPWVVFEMTDIYTIDRLVFRDVKPYENQFGNVPEYWVYVSNENPDNCEWTEVAHKKQQDNLDLKEITFDPVEARYIKLVTSRGKTSDNKFDNAIRIYGVDIYGTFSEKVERESVSVGKTILGFNSPSAYYERPLHLLDGNITNRDNRWKFTRPALTDSLIWVVIDLEQLVEVNKFRLYDAKTLEKSEFNLSGYNVYLSTEAPDISKIVRNKDGNTCWTKVVDAYAENRQSENIKTDLITPTRARYVKLEIPRTRASGNVLLFQLEVFGEKVATALPQAMDDNQWDIASNPLKRGTPILINGQGVLRIYSVQGKLVKEKTASDAQTTVSSSDMQPGVYLLQWTADNRTKTKSLIIN